MFGLGLAEIAVILLVAFICIRPKDLPVFFRKLGGLYRRITDQYDVFKSTLADIEKSIDVQDREDDRSGGE